MVFIFLQIIYCNECGDCCLLDCKSESYDGGSCTHPEKSVFCEMFPISIIRNKYYLRQCKGVAFDLLPINILNRIIDRLNQGEENFEVKTKELHFSISS
ncbi:MAG: hypothetical protein ACFFBP_06340 [Promethearchaeota archaeon]